MNAFHWDGDHLAAALPHGAHALFTTRRGGVSTGRFAALNLGRTRADIEDDDPAAVAQNRASVQKAIGRPLRISHQVHATAIATDDEPLVDADGQLTSSAETAPTVMVADCLPVAIASPAGVAMLHAGWRGLAGGILALGAAALGDGPKAAAIGPGIGVCCFEVGDDVRAAFPDHTGAQRGRNLDLKAVARRQLRAAGVEQVDDCGLCTFCEPELFFSHRRDQGVTGRQAGIAWLS
jgi:YfiH family protein